MLTSLKRCLFIFVYVSIHVIILSDGFNIAYNIYTTGQRWRIVIAINKKIPLLSYPGKRQFRSDPNNLHLALPLVICSTLVITYKHLSLWISLRNRGFPICHCYIKTTFPLFFVCKSVRRSLSFNLYVHTHTHTHHILNLIV